MLRRYMAEVGLQVFMDDIAIIAVEDLEFYEKEFGGDYHIYGILSKEECYFRPQSISFDGDGFLKCDIFQIAENRELEFKLPSIPIFRAGCVKPELVKVSCPFPYLRTVLTFAEGAISDPDSRIGDTLTIEARELFDRLSAFLVDKQCYEVLYIGQSYGKSGERSAFKRLSSHSTLQRILTTYRSEHPERHLYIMLMRGKTFMGMSFDGIHKQFEKSEEESDEHMKKFTSVLPKADQVINIAEAALIHYFKPEFNVMYVNNFPNENHKGYAQYFSLDYNMLTIELAIDFDNVARVELYTKTNRIRNQCDFIRYNLYNDPNRASMLEIFDT